MAQEQTAGETAWQRPVALFLSGQSISLFGSMLVQYAVMWYLTLTTKDGGSSWQRGKKIPNDFFPHASLFTDIHTGWVSGLAGVILHTAHRSLEAMTP